DALGRRRDPTDDRPDEGALALGAHPGMEVVGDHHKFEAGPLRLPRDVDHRLGSELLGRDAKSKLSHGSALHRGYVVGSRCEGTPVGAGETPSRIHATEESATALWGGA